MTEGAANSSSPVTEWVVRSWHAQDGLPQNTVNAILQTRDGFLWVGTNGGLARFDGLRFRTLGLQDGLHSVRISALVEDARGGVWIGTSGGGVSHWERGRLTTLDVGEGFPAGADVIAMAMDKEGSLWIGTQTGLLKWSDGKFTMLGEAEGLPRKQIQIRDLAVDQEGTLWVSALLDGVFRGKQGRFTRIEETGPDSAIYSLLAATDGAVWAGAGDGVLWKWKAGAWTRFDPSAGLPKSSFVNMAQGSDGTVWICTREAGLYRTDGEKFVPATGLGELPSQNARSVMVDREGSVWVGTVAGGLSRLAKRVLRLHGAEEGLTHPVTSIAEDPSGAWWAGTSTEGIHLFENGRFRKIEDSKISPHYPFYYSLSATGDGSIWAAGENIVCRFRAGRLERAFIEAPVRGEAVCAMCADGNAVWLGTYYSTLLKADESGVETVAPAGALGGNITCLAREAAGVLWVGTSRGIHRWENGKIRTWDRRDGLLTPSILAILYDSEGTVWVGTQGGGLARLKDGKIFNITTHEGLIDDIVTQLVVDDEGYLWLGTERGIMRLDRREIAALAEGKIPELQPMVFGRNEGMRSEQCSAGHSPTALKTQDGRLLFPTIGGVVEIDPRRLQNLTSVPPEPRIEEVLVDGRSRDLGRLLVLAAGQHRLQVRYTAPFLRGGEWARFRYRFTGLDADWVLAGSERLAVFEGLRPGRYTFEVQVQGPQGNWSEHGASLEIVQNAFFWQSFWFLVGGSLLLLAAVAAAVWWHVHRRHRRKVEELHRRHHLQVELAHVGRVSLLGELSASIAHELNQPLAAILSNAQAALRFLENEPCELGEVRDILKDISAADRRASEIIVRMRALMKKGETRLEPGDINIDISDVLLLLRWDLSRRGVQVTTQLSETLPMVSCDHVQVQQVILNLLVNGCDAMNAAAPEARELAIVTEEEGAEFVRVSVSDRGPGISADVMRRIFDPFFTTKANGLGMGLAICQAIVEAHGGRLWAESDSARGATFHFTVRTVERSRVASPEPERASVPV